MHCARQRGGIHRNRRRFLAVHNFRHAGLRTQRLGEGNRLERSHGFVGSRQPVVRRESDRHESAWSSRLRNPLDQRDLGLPSLGSYGFAYGEPPRLVFPQTGFRRRRALFPSLGKLASEHSRAGKIPPSRRPMRSIRYPLGVPLGQQWHLTGQARNASSKRDVTTLRRLSLGSYESRRLGSLHIEGCRRPTSKPSVLAPIRQSAKSAVVSFQMKRASSMAGSSSNRTSVASSRPEMASTIRFFGRLYRLRSTHSVSRRTNWLTKTRRPAATSCLISFSCLLKLSFVSRTRKRTRTLVSTPALPRQLLNRNGLATLLV